jgi:hypothetical protein
VADGDLGREYKARAQEALATGVEALCELQDRLYAQDRWAVLVIKTSAMRRQWTRPRGGSTSLHRRYK